MRRIRLRDEEGVAMTEFALILPVFVLIIAGLLSFGRVLYYWIEANHVASETARWAIVDQNPFPGQTLQEHAAQNLLVGAFLTELYRMVAEWSDWAAELVETWPEDPAAAVPDPDVMAAVVRRASWSEDRG